MIKLEFVGCKPFISPKGIEFIHSRPDKYIYIPNAIKLYLLFKDEHNWHKNKLEFEYPKEMLNDTQMLEIITKQDKKIIKNNIKLDLVTIFKIKYKLCSKEHLFRIFLQISSFNLAGK